MHSVLCMTINLMQLPDGQKVELGATWLHGIQGHPVYDLALHYGLMAPHKKKGKLPIKLIVSHGYFNEAKAPVIVV